MMNVLASIGQMPVGWAEFMRDAGLEAGFCQSHVWARIVERLDHATPIFLLVQSDGESQPSAALLVFHKIPWDRDLGRRSNGIREALLGKRQGWLEWMDGPVICSTDPETTGATLAALLAWLEEYAHERNLMFIASHGFAHTSRWSASQNVAARFFDRGYRCERWATSIVDLTLAEDVLWMNLDNAARKAVKKARRQDAVCRRVSTLDEVIKTFYGVFNASRAMEGLPEIPSSVPVCSWEADREGMYSYFVAESREGEVLATLGMYVFNGVATEIASSLSRTAMEKGIPAQDLLHWELLLEAKRRGCSTFDLAGINPNPRGDKEKGIRRFKEKWGGRHVDLMRYERDTSTVSRAARWLYSRLRSFQR